MSDRAWLPDGRANQGGNRHAGGQPMREQGAVDQSAGRRPPSGTGRGLETERPQSARSPSHHDPAASFGALLARLSGLERRGHHRAVSLLRARLRAAVRAGSVDEIQAEMLAVRGEAEVLERRP